MNIGDLKEFLINYVPNFEEPEILDNEGECYHYTPHWEKIKTINRFKDAKINSDLDQTQKLHYLAEATETIGVVFAYEYIEDAREEGFGFDIIKIRYRVAISALHKAEDFLSDYTRKLALEQRIDMEESITPKTLLILTSDILSFDWIEKAKQ